MASGCASRETVTDTETVEVVKEVIVPVDERLTRPIAPPDMEPVTWLDGVILGVQYRQKWQSCEARMAEIRSLGRNDG